MYRIDTNFKHWKHDTYSICKLPCSVVNSPGLLVDVLLFETSALATYFNDYLAYTITHHNSNLDD